MKSSNLKAINKIAYNIFILLVISLLTIPSTILPLIASENIEGIVETPSNSEVSVVIDNANIETGDVEIETETVNTINENEIVITEELPATVSDVSTDTPQESVTEIASDTPEILTAPEVIATDTDTTIASPTPSEPNSPAVNNDGTIIDNTNSAEVNNTASLSGSSGNNQVSSSSKQASIKTGDIEILNVIINYINNNFVGTGKTFIINIFNKIFQTIDLSGYGETQSPANPNTIVNSDLTINNHNTALIDNKVIITAQTGENIINSSAGESVIKTGDINIANDIINIANMNIVGNDWFFAVVNIVGELNGDLILPALKEGSPILQTDANASEENSATTSVDLIITNDNFASTTNNILINANTGNNTTSGTSNGSAISTGNINAESHIFNLVNYNIFDNTWKYVKINIFGNWDGIIEGLPAGYSYMEDENGITIYDNYLNDYNFYTAYADLIVNNNNSSTTTNDIIITANTGDNSINGGSSSTILTGDINIQNNLLNLNNLNFFGNDWEFSMINVFGNWHGNLAFGRPELWIIETIDSNTTYRTGDEITFNYIFGNNGDAPATNIMIKNSFNNNKLLDVVGSDTVLGDNGLGWKIPNLPPNSQGSFSFTAKVKKLPRGYTNVTNITSITSKELDRNFSNNTVSGMFKLAYLPSSGLNGQILNHNSNNLSIPLNLIMIKSNNSLDKVQSEDRINYSITITNNDSRPLLNSVLTDIMSNASSSQEINRDIWNLDTIYPGETVIIDYTVEINSSIKNGVYVNHATLSGQAPNGSFTALASSLINVENTVIETEQAVTQAQEITPLKPLSKNKTISRSSKYVIGAKIVAVPYIDNVIGKIIAISNEDSTTSSSTMVGATNNIAAGAVPKRSSSVLPLLTALAVAHLFLAALLFTDLPKRNQALIIKKTQKALTNLSRLPKSALLLSGRKLHKVITASKKSLLRNKQLKRVLIQLRLF